MMAPKTEGMEPNYILICRSILNKSLERRERTAKRTELM